MAYKRKDGEILVGSDGRPIGLVSIPELAKFFNVHPVTIRRWVSSKRLPQPFSGVQGYPVWQWQDINNLVEQLKNQSAPA